MGVEFLVPQSCLLEAAGKCLIFMTISGVLLKRRTLMDGSGGELREYNRTGKGHVSGLSRCVYSSHRTLLPGGPHNGRTTLSIHRGTHTAAGRLFGTGQVPMQVSLSHRSTRRLSPRYGFRAAGKRILRFQSPQCAGSTNHRRRLIESEPDPYSEEAGG